MRFKVIYISSICLVVLAGLLSLKGPRIRGIDFDSSRAVMAAGERLIVRTNQQVEPVYNSNVTIDPSAEFNVSSSGDAIFIDFKEALRSETTYSIVLSDIVSKSTGRTSQDRYEFTTPAYDYLFLRRASQSEDEQQYDRVMLRQPNGKEKLIYESSGLDELLAAGGKYVLSRINDQGTHDLMIGSRDKKPTIVDVAEKISLIQSWSSADGNFGYLATKTTTGAARTDLYLYDQRAGVSTIVEPFEGENREIIGWSISPDGAIIAVIDSNGDTYAFPVGDTSQIQYYGKSDAILGFSYDSQILYLSMGRDTTQINVINGEQDILSISEAIDLLGGSNEYSPLNSSEGLLLKTVTYAESTGGYMTFVRVKDDDEVTLISQHNTLITSVGTIKPSPNDDYIMLELSEVTNAKYDNYTTIRAPSNVRTDIMDQDGKYVLTINGFQVYATTVW